MPEAEPDREPDLEPDSEPVPDPEPDLKSDPEPEPDPESDRAPDAGPEPESELGRDSALRDRSLSPPPARPFFRRRRRRVGESPEAPGELDGSSGAMERARNRTGRRQRCGGKSGDPASYGAVGPGIRPNP